MLGIFLSLQFVPANFHAKRKREMKRDRELRTLLPMDRDFRHLPILTICPCDSTCQYIHDNSKNISYHNNNDEDDSGNILVTKLIRNQ